MSEIVFINSSGFESFLGGFCSFLLLVAIFFIVRAIIKTKKRFEPNIRTLIETQVDDVKEYNKWKNSQEYHKELLRLMEEGLSKRIAKDILLERRKIQKLENKSSLSRTIFSGESESKKSKPIDTVPSTPNNKSEIAYGSVIVDNNTVVEHGNSIDPESEFLGNVLAKFNESGKDGAIGYLIEQGYDYDSALKYLYDYMVLKN